MIHCLRELCEENDKLSDFDHSKVSVSVRKKQFVSTFFFFLVTSLSSSLMFLFFLLLYFEILL